MICIGINLFKACKHELFQISAILLEQTISPTAITRKCPLFEEKKSHHKYKYYFLLLVAQNIDDNWSVFTGKLLGENLYWLKKLQH